MEWKIFRNAFVFFIAKGLKMTLKEADFLYRSIVKYEERLEKLFNCEYVSDLIQDIAREVCSPATKSSHLTTFTALSWNASSSSAAVQSLPLRKWRRQIPFHLHNN